MSRRIVRGFTLIELLVVIGIIAVLMAILLPALARARQEAIKIQCAGNIRQWAAAMVSYSGDNSNAFPYNGTWNDSSLPSGVDGTSQLHTNGTIVMDFVEEYLSFETTVSVMESDDNIVTFCPTEQQYRNATWTVTSYPNALRIGYGIMPHRTGATSRFSGDYIEGWLTKKKFDGPFSRTPIVIDFDRTLDGNRWVGENSVSNHPDPQNTDSTLGQNMAFEDGHVEWFQPDQVEYGSSESSWDYYYKIPVAGMTDEVD